MLSCRIVSVRYRNRLEICASILKMAQKGAKKTRIMRLAFLSYPRLKVYLELLTDAKLIEFRKEKESYYTTAMGEKFLKLYIEMERQFIPKRPRHEKRASRISSKEKGGG